MNDNSEPKNRSLVKINAVEVNQNSERKNGSPVTAYAQKFSS